MLRRSRTGRSRQYTWSGTPWEEEEEEEEEDDDAVLATEREEWSRESTQISDSDPEVDFLDISPSAVEGAVPEAVPVTGESYCRCHAQEELGNGELLEASRPLDNCLCGEEDQGFDWVWDKACKSAEAFLSCEDRKVSFHSDYSCGTAAARGTRELADGQHFWEIKMTSPVYGTDMMVGIGTSEVNLEKNRHSFCSMLGADEDSWGLSYTGLLQHKGDKVSFSSRFGQGSIIGLHLDTWHGTLTFYKNRRLIGVAATKLQNRKFYPMVCSTAAKSSMKVIRSCSSPTSLQYLCCSRLRQLLPAGPCTLPALPLPPGLRHHLQARLGWVFSLDDQATPPQGPKQTGDSPAKPRPRRPDTHAVRFPLRPDPGPKPDPDPDLAPHQCPCLPGAPAARPDPSGCSPEPEDYQSKRGRWT